MRLKNVIDDSLIYSKLVVHTKKQLLEFISTALAKHLDIIQPSVLFDNFVEREKLGATGVGHGVALPHVHLDDLSHPLCLIAQLSQPLNYQAHDGLPVDIVFALVVSKQRDELHLNLLAECTRLLADESFRDEFRRCQDKATLHRLLVEGLDLMQPDV